MVIFELRDKSFDTAFELLDEAMHSAKKTKLTLCELEDAMYDCYETSDEEDYGYVEDVDIDFRNRRGYRHDEHYGMHEDEDYMGLRSPMRRGRRRSGIRRSRLGRLV